MFAISIKLVIITRDYREAKVISLRLCVCIYIYAWIGHVVCINIQMKTRRIHICIMSCWNQHNIAVSVRVRTRGFFSSVFFLSVVYIDFTFGIDIMIRQHMYNICVCLARRKQTCCSRWHASVRASTLCIHNIWWYAILFTASLARVVYVFC